MERESTVIAGALVSATALVVLTFGLSVTRGASGSEAQARSAASLYAKYCSSCHGKDGRAKTFKAKFNHARNLADPDWQSAVSDERIFNSIANGRGSKMPAFSKKLSETEIDSLVSYVRSLKR